MTTREQLLTMMSASGISPRHAERVLRKWEREMVVATLHRVQQDVAPLVEVREQNARHAWGDHSAPVRVLLDVAEDFRAVVRGGIHAAVEGDLLARQ